MENRRRVILADANESFRTMLREVIDATDDFSVVASVGDGNEALEQVRTLIPDLMLMDVVLPGLDGFGVLDQLHREGIQIKTIMVSTFFNDRTVSEAMGKGALFFMPKPCQEEALLERMRGCVCPLG